MCVNCKLMLLSNSGLSSTPSEHDGVREMAVTQNLYIVCMPKAA